MSESPGAGGTRCGGLRVAMLVSALLVSAVLGFAALAKLLGPNPKKVLLGPETWTLHPQGLLQDHVIAVAEVVVILALLVFHRRRWMWAAISVMFAGFAGYALFYLLRGESCGCFGKLWTPPEGLTLGLDILFFVLGLVLAGWKGAGALKAGIIGLLAVLGVGASGAGYVFAKRTAPPTSAQVIEQTQAQFQGKTQFDLLVESAMLADVRADMSGATHYIFVYDPQCHTCEAMKPQIEREGQQYAEQQDPVLRVKMLSVVDIKAQAGLEDHYWSPTPAVFFVRLGEVVRDGAEVRRFNGNKAIFPSEAYDQLMGEFNQLVQDGKIKL